MTQDSPKKRKMPFPPVFKVLVRGYIIIFFILILEYLGIISNISFIIFMVTVTTLSMMFGVGYLLVTYSRPVRSTGYTVPNTVLMFVKGGLVMYFISLLGHFNILPLQITSLLITCSAVILMMVGVLTYIYEVVQRSRPLQKPKRLPYRPRPRQYRDPR